VTGGKPIAVLLQSISGLNAINPLVAFYDIHGGKIEVLFFYFVPDTTRYFSYICMNNMRLNTPRSRREQCISSRSTENSSANRKLELYNRNVGRQTFLVQGRTGAAVAMATTSLFCRSRFVYSFILLSFCFFHTEI
jgi:hypothetical protein